MRKLRKAEHAALRAVHDASGDCVYWPKGVQGATVRSLLDFGLIKQVDSFVFELSKLGELVLEGREIEPEKREPGTHRKSYELDLTEIYNHNPFARLSEFCKQHRGYSKSDLDDDEYDDLKSELFAVHE